MFVYHKEPADAKVFFNRLKQKSVMGWQVVFLCPYDTKGLSVPSNESTYRYCDVV